VIRLHGGADLDEIALIDAELGDLPLGLDLGDGELAALGLGGVVHLGLAGTELNGGIAVLGHGAVAHNLTVLKPEHGYRDVRSVIGKDAGHPQLLCDQSRTHRFVTFSSSGD
jgi:hypothetical protein